MPSHHQPITDHYDLYPAFHIADDKIHLGYEYLVESVRDQKIVVIDGYGGVQWENFRSRLDELLTSIGKRSVRWVNVADAWRTEGEISALLSPFLGGSDPIFGTRFTGNLRDFFDPRKLEVLRPDPAFDLNILYGCGAALANWNGLLVYVEVPKNEIQFRSRAGSVANLGAPKPEDPKGMYKRFYFVDWPALNKHKATTLPRIDWVIDEQRPDEPAIMAGQDLRAALNDMAHSYFRARPWFEPGAWGGQWIKKRIPELPQNVPNYAWSFELISPENGLIIESSGNLLEVPFDMLMAQEYQAIMGDYAQYFGVEFPIRFDFLDTFDGGNLSVQCHPSQHYIRENFGETFTQDETYYILDCADGARVYLGFREGIDPAEFRRVLETSFQNATPVDINKYINAESAHKHDLFLIPNGTVHCSGKDVLVLEISATPYIFTFKMYDWLRLDLDGKPRPINIDRAFANLKFERQGERAKQELVSKPYEMKRGDGWRIIHVPTHAEHFYDVYRYEITTGVEITTNGSPHVLSLVEGDSVTLELPDGRRQQFNYAETFVIPAATGKYRLVNPTNVPIITLISYLKPEWFARPENQWLSPS